jgi:oxygen-independent coproporphyrinogen-3 oxidase
LSEAGFGLYIHWPYCARICPYCDFNVARARGREGEAQALARAICDDLTAWRALTGARRLGSIFFGGGTPSLMAPADVAEIIARAADLWETSPDLEVTLEANPADAASFAALAAAGVNRLSLGVQSLDGAALKFLGRDHDAACAIAAARAAADALPRVSLDLIYALPGQEVPAWAEELAAALELDAEHVSAYQLTLEAGTPFSRAVARGAWTPPDPELAADLFETTQSVLSAAGFEAYEVSNHARGSTARCRHNLLYWTGGDWAGIGPGAHGRVTREGRRFATLAPRRAADYIARVGARGDLGAALEPLSARETSEERLLMGLRWHGGVPLADLAPLEIAPATLADLAGLVEVRDGRLAATPAGRLVLDSVIARLALSA